METFRTNQEAYDAWKRSSMGNYDPAPIAFARGQGSRLWDVEGKPYLDFAAGVAVASVGHGHPKLSAAIADQAQRLVHTSNLYVVAHQVRLGQRLTSLSGLDRAFFCNSGTEALEATIKLARYWGHQNGGRYRIVAAQRGFHGRTFGALSATGQPHYHEGFEPLLEGFDFVPFGDVAALRAAVTDETCAILLEPVQGEGGVHVAPSDYLQAVRDLCDERNLLFLLDEVQTGIGRTGTWFAYEHAGVRPDVVALAKGLGGGVPIGAVLCNARANVFRPGAHGSTFGGNPLATRAALAVLDIIDEEGLRQHVVSQGAHLLSHLATWEAHGRVAHVRGLGLLVGFDLPQGGARALAKRLAHAGLLVTACGDATLRLCPPLTITAAEIEEGLEILAKALGVPPVQVRRL